MEFVEGPRLDEAWPKLSPEERTEVASQVKDYYNQLRKLPIPHGARIGSLNGGNAIDRGGLEPEKGGTFDSVADFNRWLMAKNPSSTTDIVAKHCSAFLNAAKMQFTHGDFIPENFIWRDRRLVLIDFEDSGYYPEWLEYCRAVHFWDDAIEKVLFASPYDKEYASYRFLGKNQEEFLDEFSDEDLLTPTKTSNACSAADASAKASSFRQAHQPIEQVNCGLDNNAFMAQDTSTKSKKRSIDAASEGPNHSHQPQPKNQKRGT